MSTVLVLVPQSLPAPATNTDTMLVHFHAAFDAIVSLRASDLPTVIVTDGMADEDLEAIASTLRERTAPCIEVRYAAWDGETHSPVSGLCRGVISGFGAAGLTRAVEFLAAD